MRAIKELSKDELISLIYNIHDYPENGYNVSDPLAECASCGNTGKAEYYFICDRCNESDKAIKTHL